MVGREAREYTNLSDPKDKKCGKGKDRIDDEDITFQRMVAKEQMEAEDDAERHLLPLSQSRRHKHASLPLPLRVEPKPKSGIRQHDLLKSIVEVKPKWQRVSSPSNGMQANRSSPASATSDAVKKWVRACLLTTEKIGVIINRRGWQQLARFGLEVQERCIMYRLLAQILPDSPKLLLSKAFVKLELLNLGSFYLVSNQNSLNYFTSTEGNKFQDYTE